MTTPDDAANNQFAYWFHLQEPTRDAVVHRVWSFAGLGYSHMSQTCDPVTARDALDAYTLAFPMWMLAALFAVWPVGFVTVRFLRKKRRAWNLGPACGYDLRTTPDPAGPRLARCPECGRAVVRHASR